MRPASLVVATWLALTPALAQACPACARETSGAVAWLIGAMIVLPLLLGATILLVARKLQREDGA